MHVRALKNLGVELLIYHDRDFNLFISRTSTWVQLFVVRYLIIVVLLLLIYFAIIIIYLTLYILVLIKLRGFIPHWYTTCVCRSFSAIYNIRSIE